MIVNIFSTPRTGSTWFGLYQRQLILNQGKKANFVSEPFNEYHYRLYHFDRPDGAIENHHEYQEGRYYKKMILLNSEVKTEKIYSKKTKTLAAENESKRAIIEKCATDMIIHNHVAPLDKQILKWLIGLGEKNYMVIRKNVEQQLASYAVAYHTKQFVSFGGTKSAAAQTKSIINEEVLRDLLQRIAFQRQLLAESGDTFDVVSYENINFLDFPGGPKKQNTNAFESLVPEDREKILKLIAEAGLLRLEHLYE